MMSSRVLTFDELESYQQAVRATDATLYVTGRGAFSGELVQIELHGLWLQRGTESLGRICYSASDPKRAPIMFLADMDEAPMQHCGLEFRPGEVAVYKQGSTSLHRTFGRGRWATMSLAPEDLAAAGRAIVDRELEPPTDTYAFRPAAASMTRLMALHQAAVALATSASPAGATSGTSKALQQHLVHAMVRCLAEPTAGDARSGFRQHTRIIGRFEDFLASRRYESVYLAEMCAAIGVSERTLRTCCQEHFGMGPVRYLWLRRMHLARRSLLRADAGTVNVTTVATEYGFWELGRFSVEYRALFGESPSAALRRPLNATHERTAWP